MNNETAKQVADWGAGGITAATLFGYMPQIAALFTAAYMLVRLWESDTVRRLLRAVCARCAAWWES